MKTINFFAGPGTGKSTTSAGVFYDMKQAGYKVELVQEHAKDLVYEENWKCLQDQLLVTANQNHRNFRLYGKVDYAIHDSPVLLGVIYSKYIGALGEAYENFVVELFKSQDSINIFLERDLDDHPYQEYGRNQNLQEAQEIDAQIKMLLIKHSIPFINVPMASAKDFVYNEVILKGSK